MIPLLLALLCVAANAFFVAAEFALAKVRPTSLDAMARAGDPKAARALAVTRRLDAYLTATQIGITLASLGLGWLGRGHRDAIESGPGGGRALAHRRIVAGHRAAGDQRLQTRP